MTSLGEYHYWNVKGELFELRKEYSALEYLGSGAYGVVVSAMDTNSNNLVAIKKSKNIFSSRSIAKRTLREIRLLRCFRHDNIVKIHKILKPIDMISYCDIYIVFEALQTDLAQIIRSPQPITIRHTQYFTFQLCNAIAYLHTCNVVHRDLKPRNLLVNGNCTLKVADFGLSRIYNDSNATKMLAMTEYVTTRWYRAPEILVGYPTYGKSVDIWAVGCILGELILRYPVFPGKDSKQQFSLIVDRLGKPGRSFCSQVRKPYFKKLLDNMTEIAVEDIETQFPTSTKPCIDLLLKCLAFDPADRITAEEALEETFFKFSRQLDFKVEKLEIDMTEFSFEENVTQNSVDKLREEITMEIEHYNKALEHTESQAVTSNGKKVIDHDEDDLLAKERRIVEATENGAKLHQATGKSQRTKTVTFNSKVSNTYLFECLTAGAVNSGESPSSQERKNGSSIQCTVS